MDVVSTHTFLRRTHARQWQRDLPECFRPCIPLIKIKACSGPAERDTTTTVALITVYRDQLFKIEDFSEISPQKFRFLHVMCAWHTVGGILRWDVGLYRVLLCSLVFGN